MAGNNRQKMPKLSRDLLNLALILAFLHIDPDFYLPTRSNKIMDELSSLGDFYRNQFDFNEPFEISAYVLTNAESSINSAVNSNNESQLMAEDDSGVSDVDSHQSEIEDFHHSESASLASPLNSAQDLILEEDSAWMTDIKIEEETIVDDTVIEAPTPTPQNLNYDPPLFDVDDSSNIFRDLDDIFGQSSSNLIEEAASNNPTETKDQNEYSPDEEDMENQLMHIDDRLICLDENIDGLDQQLSWSSVEENFLLSSIPEVLDPMEGINNTEIDDLIAQGLPSPLMPMPFLIEADEPKDICPGENPVIKEEIKEEIIEEAEIEVQETEPFWVNSPAASLASTNLPKDDDEEEISHLIDHNYALNAFEECFGSPKNSYADSESDFSSVGGASALNRESRDERKARELNLPFAVADIIDLPIDAFNELLSKFTLTDDQMALCRDIRRRGKNKVAAQNCRKRKMDLISQLEDEVGKARRQKQQLIAEREELYRLRSEWTSKLLNLERTVLQGLKKNVKDYTLDYTGAQAKVIKAKA